MAEHDPAAAELALGLLDGEERAAALRRVLAEPGFAADVEWWRGQFAALFDLWPEAEPGPGVAARIAASLDGTTPPVVVARRSPWPLLAAVMSAIAACLLLFILLDPAPTIPVSQPVPVARPTSVLVATLEADGEGAEPIATVFNPATATLRIAASPAVPANRVAQLWAIGADGVPHPLALLNGVTTTLPLDAANRRRIVAGAVLAISVEPTGGSPTGLPTGPVVAKGVLARV